MIKLSEYCAFDHTELVWVFSNLQTTPGDSLLTEEKVLNQITSLMKNFLNSNFQIFFEDVEKDLDLENFLDLYQCCDSYYVKDLPKNSRNVVNSSSYKSRQKEFLEQSKRVPKDILSLIKVWMPRFEGETIYRYIPKEVIEECTYYRESIKDNYQLGHKELDLYQLLRKESGLPETKRFKQSVRFHLENEVYSRCKSKVFFQGLPSDYVFKFLSVGVESKEIKVIPITENITLTIVPINRAHELIS